MSWGNSLSCPMRSVAAVSGLESRGGDVSFSLTFFLLLFLSWTVWGGGGLLEVHAEVKFSHSVLMDSTER